MSTSGGDASRVASLTAIFDHLHDMGLVHEDAWVRLRPQAQSRAVEWPAQSEADEAAAWNRGSLPDREYRSARLHLDLKDALQAQADDTLDCFDNLDCDLRTRVATFSYLRTGTATAFSSQRKRQRVCDAGRNCRIVPALPEPLAPSSADLPGVTLNPVNRELLKTGLGEALGDGTFEETRLTLAAHLARIYEDLGVVVSNQALPLWRDCPCGAPCWAALPETWQPGRDPADPADPSNGGIVLPWLGRGYRPGGVVVLGVNLREASGMYVEYEIARTQPAWLKAGCKKPHNSWWAYRSCRSAAAVLRSIAGARAEELDVAEPEELAEVLDTTARVQAVKCSSKDGARSERTDEMNANCPPRCLRRELAVLRPAALVAFGDETWSAMERIGQIDEAVGGTDFSRSIVHVDGHEFEMVWLRHPSSVGRRWERSFELLLGNLAAAPLRSFA